MVGAYHFTGMGGNLVRIGGKTSLQSADNGIGGIDIQVHHRAEIEIDPGLLQAAGNAIRLLVGKSEIVFSAKGCGGHRGREARILFQSGDAPAFLIDGNQQRRFPGGSLELRGKSAQLLRGNDIPGRVMTVGTVIEQYDPAEMSLAYIPEDGMFPPQVGSGESDQQQLPQRQCRCCRDGGLCRLCRRRQEKQNGDNRRDASPQQGQDTAHTGRWNRAR